MDDLAFDQYLKTEFLQEAAELAELIERSLLALERSDKPGPLIDEVFRYLHTIKGSAKAAGFHVLGDFAHRTENILSEVRTGEREMTESLRVMFLQCNDVLSLFINALYQDHDATVEFEDPTLAYAEPPQIEQVVKSVIQQNISAIEPETDGRKILVVDDEQGILDLIGENLEEIGFEPFCCLNGKEAVARLIKGMRPVAAIVDLAMPGMDGLELTRRIRECDPTISVIVCSGFAGKKEVAQFLNMGAFGYLDKPAKHLELTLVVENAVKTTRMRRLSRDLAHLNLQTFRDLIKVTSEILAEHNDRDLKAQIKELEERFGAIGKITRSLASA